MNSTLLLYLAKQMKSHGVRPDNQFSELIDLLATVQMIEDDVDAHSRSLQEHEHIDFEALDYQVNFKYLPLLLETLIKVYGYKKVYKQLQMSDPEKFQELEDHPF